MSWPRVKSLEVYNKIFHRHMGNSVWTLAFAIFTSLPDNKYVRIYAMRSAKMSQEDVVYSAQYLISRFSKVQEKVKIS